MHKKYRETPATVHIVMCGQTGQSFYTQGMGRDFLFPGTKYVGTSYNVCIKI